MRSCLLIILFILPLSGCSTSELLAVVEKERIDAERLYIADTLCMKYREFGNGNDYNSCIENVLGVEQKAASNDPIRAGKPVEASETDRLSLSPPPRDCTPIPMPVISQPKDICQRYGYTKGSEKYLTCLTIAEGSVESIPQYSVIPDGCEIASGSVLTGGINLFAP